MDYLRSCYRSRMRLYSDRPDILTPGRWHFCPPGAIVAPPSVFFSRRWDDHVYGDDALGEVQQRYYRYYEGVTDPRLTGTHYCGDPSVWLEGIPTRTGQASSSTRPARRCAARLSQLPQGGSCWGD